MACIISPGRAKLNRGFTLIELLVVIAIISLLVSILLPSLSQAKQLAKQVICQSNLRNLSLPFNMYASENDEYAVPCTQPNESGVGVYRGGIWYEFLQTQGLSQEQLACPSHLEFNYDNHRNFGLARISYGYNAAHVGWHSEFASVGWVGHGSTSVRYMGQYLRLSEIHKPEKTVLFADNYGRNYFTSDTPGKYSFQIGEWSYPLADRHVTNKYGFGRVNIIFVSGEVLSWDPGQIDANRTMTELRNTEWNRYR